MNREPWVAYIVVIVVVAAMMYGKYLMARGDKESKENDNESST